MSRTMADYFEEVASLSGEPKLAANWILNDLIFLLQENKKGFVEYPVPANNLAELISLITKGTISGKIAKDLLGEMVRTGKNAGDVMAEKSLEQINDPEKIAGIVREIMAANPKQLEQYRKGKSATFGWFVGQVMKATRGQANPQLVQEVLKQELG
jgi:aspartyl-tRNA(Asn)/glutamyl-tRNA(Gln) amidotransferase subunit B